MRKFDKNHFEIEFLILMKEWKWEQTDDNEQ